MGEKGPRGVPKDKEWMSGRLVFRRPEGLASNAVKRDIVRSPEEAEALSRAHAETTLARRALTAAQLEEEIAAFREWERARESKS